MQIKKWIVIAGLLVAAPMLVACGEEKADETAPAAEPAAPAGEPAAPADGAPATEGEDAE